MPNSVTTQAPTSVIPWIVISCVVIALASPLYWWLETEKTMDEFITALSWGSLIAIMIGGLTAFGANMNASLAKFRKDPLQQQRENIENAQQSKPAAFGMITAGVIFLLVTVSIEWVANNLL
ncbi:MAG: hypothetical protein AAF434_10405 [Pseudomonadota bacterium]